MSRPIALITGASAGLGSTFARRLASTHDLVLVARTADRLDQLAKELNAQHGTESEVLPVDLAADPSPAEARLHQGDRPVDLLINSAGFGTFGEFGTLPLEEELREIQLNVVALVRLTEPVTDVVPIEPVRAGEQSRWAAGAAATVVGWGVTSEAGTVASDDLRAVRLTIRPDTEMSAATAYGSRFRASDMIGAGGDAGGGQDACYGDSGGPLVVSAGRAGLRQVGIVSFGAGCGRAGYPGVYSRLGEGPVRAFADSLVALRVAPVRVAEGATARFTLMLARPSTLPVSVGWATAGQTATAGADFRPGRGVARIDAGQTAATVDVPVTADKLAESDETFRLRLSAPLDTWLAGDSVVATIVDGG